MIREMDTLWQALDETANGVDEFTHNVPDLDLWINFPLENLEFYVIATDPDNPYQYLNLLKRVKDSINPRIESLKVESDGL